MTIGRYLRHALMGIGLGLASLHTVAQEARDPTQAPSDAMALPGATQNTAPTQSTAVIMQDGTPYLVVGTRLVAVGQKVGTAKLERITETEIWLRDGKQLTRVPRFSGIQRTVAKPVPVCAPSVRKKRSGESARAPARVAAPNAAPHQAAHAAAPCEGGQP